MFSCTLLNAWVDVVNQSTHLERNMTTLTIPFVFIGILAWHTLSDDRIFKCLKMFMNFTEPCKLRIFCFLTGRKKVPELHSSVLWQHYTYMVVRHVVVMVLIGVNLQGINLSKYSVLTVNKCICVVMLWGCKSVSTLTLTGHASHWGWKAGPHKVNHCILWSRPGCRHVRLREGLGLVMVKAGVSAQEINSSQCNVLICDKDEFFRASRCLWSWMSWWSTGTRSCSGGRRLDGSSLRRRWRRRRSAGGDLTSPPCPFAPCWSSEKPSHTVRKRRLNEQMK